LERQKLRPRFVRQHQSCRAAGRPPPRSVAACILGRAR
jgi:hypothetical protein